MILAPAWCIAASFTVLLCGSVAFAGTAFEGEVTLVTGSASIHTADGAVCKARVGDRVHPGDELQTGAGVAKAEVRFSDGILARLGCDTTVLAMPDARELRMNEGMLLLQTPHRAKKLNIHAGDYSVAGSEGTVLLEWRPSVYKLLVLEGISRLYRPKHFGDSMLVRSGQLVIGDPAEPVSDPVDFDIARFLQTSHFIRDFAPLPSRDSIMQASEKQFRERSRKGLAGTNLVIFGGGSVVSLLAPAGSQAALSTKLMPFVSAASANSGSDLGVVEELRQAPASTASAGEGHK